LTEDEDMMIRSQIWNRIVNEILIEQEVERLGIIVTDEEVRNVLTGNNPPEFLVQQFRDSTGTFHRDAYLNAIQDKQYENVMIQVEDMIRQQEKQNKLQRLLVSSIGVGEGEIRQKYISSNINAEADYISFEMNRLVPDSAVNITDDDLQSQYDSHPENFQTKAMRKIKYVFFSQKPSSEDTAAAEEKIRFYLDKARTVGTDFLELARLNSELPVVDAYFKHNELSPLKDNAVFSANKGAIIGPLTDADGMHIIKILDQRRGSKEYIRLSQILLRIVSGPDSVRMIQEARSIAARARSGADFAKLAGERSQDYQSAMQGGDLGWRTKEELDKPISDAAFRGSTGEIIGPVRTQRGWHIIKITGKDNKEVKIADIAVKITASAQTYEIMTQSAREFSYLAKEEGYEKAAENSKYQVLETQEFTKEGSIPSIGINDALKNFAFSNKVGDISDPITARSGVIVAMVSKVREEGTRPFDEVKVILRSMALKEKKMEVVRKQAEEFYRTNSGSGDLIPAAKSNPNLIVGNTGQFRLSGFPSGIGRDLNFIGTAFGMKPGETSKPFEGNSGYFIIKLVSKTEFDTAKYNSERDLISMQLLQEKRQRILSEWQTALNEKAEIIDNRDKYGR
jgi:peptidyl-prolyl cis-trans isomerase D